MSPTAAMRGGGKPLILLLAEGQVSDYRGAADVPKRDDTVTVPRTSFFRTRHRGAGTPAWKGTDLD
jgi:hypothetical protein